MNISAKPAIRQPEATLRGGKRSSMRDAIGRHVRPGDTIFFAGMQHGEPSAAIHEIVRQKIDRLTAVSALTRSVALLLGEGLLKTLVSAYLLDLYEKESCVGARARRLGAFPKIEELSHYGLSLALLAGQMGVPFLSTRSQLGSSFLNHNPNLKETRCPFTGEKLAAVRAINPDVAIVHVQRCDENGAAHRWGSLGMDIAGINASKKLIITTEELVGSDEIKSDPNRTLVPSFRVTAVVLAPWGAYPLHLAGKYHSDENDFSAACRDESKFEEYAARYIYGVAGRTEMMARLASDKGAVWLERLRIRRPMKSAPIVTGF